MKIQEEKRANNKDVLKKRKQRVGAKEKLGGDKKKRATSGVTGTKKKNDVVAPPAGDIREIDSDGESEEDDDDYEPTEWKIVEHGVCANNGECRAMFKAISGKRKNGADKYNWVERKYLIQDGVKSVDEYIRTKCDHPYYANLIPTTSKKKTPTKVEQGPSTTEIVPTKRVQCQHGVYNAGITYTSESNGAYCGTGYYLFGLTCGNGCGTAFGTRQSMRGDSQKVVVPSGSAPVYCCINITGGKPSRENDIECKHAVCSDCWTAGILNDGGTTRKRQSTRGGG